MPINIPTLKKELQDKRHIWKRIRTLVEHDETDEGLLSDVFIPKNPGETPVNYRARKDIFVQGFQNPTMELISSPGQTIFNNSISENIEATETDRLWDFSANCTMGAENKLPLRQWMKEQVCPNLRAYGTVFAMMDMPVIMGDMSEQDQKERRVWPYVSLIHPLQVLNYEWVNGEFEWFAFKVTAMPPWHNPLLPPPDQEKQIRIWTRNEYIVIRLKDAEIIKRQTHNWGFVPVIPQASFLPHSGDVIGLAPFFVTSNYIIYANRLYSTAGVEAYKHNNLTLLMNEDSILSSNSEVDAQGHQRIKKTQDGILTWSGEHKPEYLTKELDAIDKSMDLGNKWMMDAFDNEKSAKSVAKSGYDGSDYVKSGFAMVVEREPILANIMATAMDMESLHNKMLMMADKMIHDGERTQKTDYVTYDMDYDITPMDAFVEETGKIMTVSKSPTVKRERQKALAAREIEDPKIRQEAFDEIDSMTFDDNSIGDESLLNLIDSNQDDNNV